jgi:hypothetical protein
MSQITAPITSSFLVPHVAPTLHDRRKDHRRSVLTKGVLKVMDGAHAGESFDVLTREVSMAGLSFLLREALNVGQTCMIEMAGPGGRTTTHQCEIVRSRPVSNGRYEMAVQFRAKPQ